MEGTPSIHKSQPTYRETALWELLQFGRVNVFFLHIFFSSLQFISTVMWKALNSQSPSQWNIKCVYWSMMIDGFFFLPKISMCITEGILYCMYHSPQFESLTMCRLQKTFVATVQKVHFVSNHHSVCAHTLKKHPFSFCNLFLYGHLQLSKVFVSVSYIKDFNGFESCTNNVQADLIIYFYLVWNFKMQIKWN